MTTQQTAFILSVMWNETQYFFHDDDPDPYFHYDFRCAENMAELDCWNTWMNFLWICCLTGLVGTVLVIACYLLL